MAIKRLLRDRGCDRCSSRPGSRDAQSERGSITGVVDDTTKAGFPGSR